MTGARVSFIAGIVLYLALSVTGQCCRLFPAGVPRRCNAMSMRDNRFVELEKGGGLLYWAVRQLALWVSAGLGVYLLFASHDLFMQRDTGTLLPAPVPAAATKGASADLTTNSLMLRASRDGSVYADTEINGIPIRMAFDTGASFVTLTEADATRAGVAGSLNYTLPIATGNGKVNAAPVTLRELRIGQLDLNDVRAVVMPDLAVSLLGQSFLSRLDSYRMQDGVMTLTWQ
jgi:aspartyl protease family protein